ncbi:MAG: PDZ domain-containing protein, partial [Vicinamibacteria bacterium]
VLRHLLGELVNSHISVSGPRESSEERPSVGLLAADYELADDRYRVKRIVRGSYWDEVTGPLGAPGVGVEEGDYILEVNGHELRPPASIYSLFVDTVGQPVTLRVNSSPRLEGSRMVTVTPIESEGALRRRSWIERNRKEVDELSGGRIAYVYQPDTSDDSLVEFDRYFFPQSDRHALILDERFNDGGGDPDYQLDVLDRQQVHWYRNRNEAPFKSPFHIIAGPKVMLVNAEAGSGGDVYPYQFKIRRLGDTVGTRTWGGVQGGGAGPPLMDGGFARVPNLGTWSPDGKYVLENTGFTPDVEVQVFPIDDFTGRDPQLERAVETLLQRLERRLPPPVPSLETVDRSWNEQPENR